jgi:hypothetical protein
VTEDAGRARRHDRLGELAPAIEDYARGAPYRGDFMEQDQYLD